MIGSGATGFPDFIVAGAARTGTTWLHEMLYGHAGLPYGIKETDFFGKRYSEGWSWYLAHFRGCSPGLPMGEVCPTYFDSALARERIARYAPRCKIVCTLRDPVKRLYSLYKLMRLFAWTSVDFEQALKRHRQMLESSRYTFHVQAWQATFGADNVRVLLYDDLEADPHGYLRQFCDFIGIAPIDSARSPAAARRVNTIAAPPASRRVARMSRGLLFWLNAHRFYRLTALWHRSRLWNLCFGGGPPFAEIDPQTDRELRAYFRLEIESLEKLLQRDLSAWKANGHARRARDSSRDCAERGLIQAAEVEHGPAGSAGLERTAQALSRRTNASPTSTTIAASSR